MTAEPQQLIPETRLGHTAHSIAKLLELRHPAPQWVTWEELRGGTGFAGYGQKTTAQRIDFFALNTWLSSDYRCVAYEIKVSRSDFLRELKQPQKRLFAESVSHECYFAVPHGLVMEREIPEPWGLVTISMGGARVLHSAQVREIDPWPMHFIASLLRRSAPPHEPSSKTLWTRAGREMDESHMAQVVSEMSGAHLAAEYSRGYADGEDSHNVQRLREIEAVAQEITGAYFGVADALRRWAERAKSGQSEAVESC